MAFRLKQQKTKDVIESQGLVEIKMSIIWKRKWQAICCKVDKRQRNSRYPLQ